MAKRSSMVKVFHSHHWLQVGDDFIRKSSIEIVETYGDFIRLTTSAGKVYRIDGKQASAAIKELGFNEKL